MGIRTFRILIFLFGLALSLSAEQKELPSGGHRGEIRSIVVDQSGSSVYSAGRDGTVVRWDAAAQAAAERFQLSPYGLTALALRPGTNELAVAESDGFGLYRVSVWDFKEKRKLFTLRFRDAVSYLAYSERGSYLIVARNALDGLVLLDPQTGDRAVSFSATSGPVVFAATGKSERTMLSCSSSGDLSYWNLADGSRIQRASVPADLTVPALFGSGRFLAGIVDSQLVVLDALKGTELGRKPLPGRSVLVPGETNATIRYLRKNEDGYYAGTVSVEANNALAFSPETYVFLGSAGDASPKASALGAVIFAATTNGTIASTEARGEASVASEWTAGRFRTITDASYASGQGLALGLGDEVIRIPPTPGKFDIDSPRSLIAGKADRLLALDGGALLVWSVSGDAPPWTYDDAAASLPPRLGLSAPPTAADRFGRFALVLDSNGNLSLFDTHAGIKTYAFSSTGMLDAAIIDGKRIAIAKSASVPPFAPIVVTNTATGETAPLGFPGKAAVRLHRGASGLMYAIIADSDDSGPITKLIRFDPDKPSPASTLFEYRSEDVQASIAEVGAAVATTLGGDGISLFTPSGFCKAERTESLPKKILAAEGLLVAVCDDGSLAWHDPESGRTVAEFRVSGREWELRYAGTTKTGVF